MKWLKTIAKGILKEELAQTEYEIKSLSKEISYWTERYKEQLKLYNDLVEKNKIEPEAEYWNNKWPTNEITYGAQNGLKRDVRSFITTNSVLLKPLAKNFSKFEENDRVLRLLQYVARKVTFTSDEYEYWQHPEITLQRRKGDCEDMCFLLASLIIMSGISNHRVKVCCGWVDKPTGTGQVGHAYVIFLADDKQWYVLDPAYFPDKSKDYYKKIPHKELDQYNEIWFTFNNELAWSEHKYNIPKEGIKNAI